MSELAGSPGGNWAVRLRRWRTAASGRSACGSVCRPVAGRRNARRGNAGRPDARRPDARWCNRGNAWIGDARQRCRSDAERRVYAGNSGSGAWSPRRSWRPGCRSRCRDGGFDGPWFDSRCWNSGRRRSASRSHSSGSRHWRRTWRSRRTAGGSHSSWSRSRAWRRRCTGGSHSSWRCCRPACGCPGQ